ncbi:Pathogenesis associated protein Cap20 [Geosmithia morbida]|uniref:Pathogenesis associated protein Cap20 n=1 Tax=Geosmithia morbida TaxID=1094350 RepID=A0A9P4Z1Q8_9HYPO|nr:Pathogenesis associated protein Cap20 [Geosmithia morbida]KAF4125827.1 Pathogenesis associated protein Cap20 [Geosmithia morbida]
MAASQVNGEVNNVGPHSAFLQHLLGYPIISDGIDTFKSHELGQRSIKLGDSAYKTLASTPVVPYLTKAYGYVSPYITRADNFGDKTLGQLDERFPVVKKPTGEIYSDTKSLVLTPYTKGLEGRDHVLTIYSTEVKKNGEQKAGVIVYGKAAVVTALVVSNETLAWVSGLLSAKKTQATEVVSDKVNSTQ